MKKQSKLEQCLNRDNEIGRDYCHELDYTGYSSCNMYLTKEDKAKKILKKIGIYSLIAAPPIIGGIIGYSHPFPHASLLQSTLRGAGLGLTVGIATASVIGLCSIISHIGEDWGE